MLASVCMYICAFFEKCLVAISLPLIFNKRRRPSAWSTATTLNSFMAWWEHRHKSSQCGCSGLRAGPYIHSLYSGPNKTRIWVHGCVCMYQGGIWLALILPAIFGWCIQEPTHYLQRLHWNISWRKYGHRHQSFQCRRSGWRAGARMHAILVEIQTVPVYEYVSAYKYMCICAWSIISH